MKPAIVLLLAVALSTCLASAQTAENLILQGRLLLSAKDLAGANDRFSLAITKAPSSETANALMAATRLLNLVSNAPAQGMMNRLGMSTQGRDIYNWKTTMPKDRRGRLVPPSGLGSGELVALLRTNLLPEVSAATANLAKVGSRDFLLSLSSNETSVAAVVIDYGDIRLMEAVLHAAEFLLFTFKSYNLNVPLDALYDMEVRDELTVDRMLKQFPALLKFANTDDLPRARNAFAQAVSSYEVASDFIRARPTNVVRLFNYDKDTAADEAKFRTTLSELRASLNAVVKLTQITNSPEPLQVSLGSALNGGMPIRDLLPSIENGSIISGSLPDVTFNNAVLGLREEDVYLFLSKGLNIPVAWHLMNAKQRLDGTIEIAAHVMRGHRYSIETSTDLMSWAAIGASTTAERLLVFDDPFSISGKGNRFYRVRDVDAIVEPPGFVSPPRSQRVVIGQSAAFSVIAKGTPPFSYVWKRNGTVLAGLTGSTFRLDKVSVADAGSYSVTVSNTAGAVTSQVAVLDVLVPPAITTQPKSVSAVRNQDATLFVVAAGSLPLNYVWKKNGTVIKSASANSLIISQAAESDAGNYTVAVSNAAGTVASNTAILDVLVPPSIPANPRSLSVLLGQSGTFSADASGTAPLTYEWKKNGTVLTGANGSTLTITRVSEADAGSYTVTVSNFAGTVTSGSAVLHVRVAPSIVTQPKDLTVIKGRVLSAALSVVAAGSTPFTYVWRRNGTVLKGANSNTLTIQSPSEANAGSYTVTVSNSVGTVTSDVAVLVVLIRPLITIQPKSASVAKGQTASFSISATGSPPLTYVWKRNGAAVAGATDSTLTLPSVAVANAGSYTVTVGNGAGSVTSTAVTLTVR
ncbi:MAG: hypothetical protein EXS31_05725 [Pedosphaera sp.]|nr:hypothetical protein [Pedosphaera sp.]